MEKILEYVKRELERLFVQTWWFPVVIALLIVMVTAFVIALGGGRNPDLILP